MSLVSPTSSLLSICYLPHQLPLLLTRIIMLLLEHIPIPSSTLHLPYQLLLHELALPLLPSGNDNGGGLWLGGSSSILIRRRRRRGLRVSRLCAATAPAATAAATSFSSRRNAAAAVVVSLYNMKN